MNGKGSRPRPVQGDRFRANWDNVFAKKPTKRVNITCDICGKIISYADLDNGKAIRSLATPDSDYSTETYDTFHVKCVKP